jgi:hypothetical protein
MERFEQRLEYFRLFDAQHLVPNEWMKVEALAALAGAGDVRQLRADRQGCDLWFQAGGQEWWMAVRGLATSYAGAGPNARPTVASVEALAREIDKIKGLAGLAGGSPSLLLAAFPFGLHPSEEREWSSQLLRFEAKGISPVRRLVVELRPQRESRLYLFA